MTTIHSQTPETVHAEGRSAVYSLLARAFAFPSGPLHESIQTGELLTELQTTIAALSYAAAEPAILAEGLPQTPEELQQQYMALFDVGGPHGPPCSLYEGEFGGGRLKVLEEVLRFYHHFGLQLSHEKGKRERPDHISIELSFLHVLSFKEAEIQANGRDASAYQRAERDFLRVHLSDFLSQLADRVGPKDIPFYSNLVKFGDKFCRADLAYLASL